LVGGGTVNPIHLRLRVLLYVKKKPQKKKKNTKWCGQGQPLHKNESPGSSELQRRSEWGRILFSKKKNRPEGRRENPVSLQMSRAEKKKEKGPG